MEAKALGQDDVGKLLWRFSAPAIVGMLVNALYNIVDSIFVGNGVGAIGLTAVTVAFPIMLILMAFAMLVGVGASTIVSLRLGEQNKTGAEKVLGNAVFLILLLSLVMSAAGLFFLDPLLTALGADAAILPYSKEFTRIILAGSIFMYIGFGLNNIIRAEGNPRLAMTTMLISALLNTILNPLFIFVLKLGIGGSALATVSSQFVSSLWVLGHFFSRRSLLKLHWRNLMPDKAVLSEIIAIGLSPFLMQLAASVVTLLYNFGLMKYGGDLAVAAMGVINRVTMLMLMPVFGISQGVQPIIGYNYGARQYQRVLAAVKKAAYAASAVCLFGFLIIQIFDNQIIRLFNANQELVTLGSQGLRIQLSMLPVIGFQVIAANYFQAIGKARYAILFSMSRQVIILIPMILLLPHFFQLHGLWFAGPVADLASSALTGTFLLRELRRLKGNEKTS